MARVPPGVEEPDARDVLELIAKEGRTGVALPGDLRDEQFCLRLVGAARERLGGLDILVPNAGRQQGRELYDGEHPRLERRAGAAVIADGAHASRASPP